MNRRNFSKHIIMLGMGVQAGSAKGNTGESGNQLMNYYEEPVKKLPVRKFDVVITGGGTAGVVAALAAARQGAKTILIEKKGYTGGTVVEGGTGIHSFFNIWTAFPGVKKRQVVKGIPDEIIVRLTKIGGSTGYPEMLTRFDYDSVGTAIDTELYKLLTHRMLVEAGVSVAVNTLLTDAIVKDNRLTGVITENHSGREAVYAKSFIDCTGYGDLSARAGAEYTVPNDYHVVNSVGIGNVSMEKYYEFLVANDALFEYCRGPQSGMEDQIIRLSGHRVKLPAGFADEAQKIGMSTVTTTVHDNYFMFIKLNLELPGSCLDRDVIANAELELRERMYKAVQLFQKYVPGCENAFMARTSPSLTIRRGRQIVCDYDITHEDVIEARHFDDDVFVYSFHDSAPKYLVKDGGTYGFPYRAICVKGLDNLYAAGMLITSDHRAHMSTPKYSFQHGAGTGSRYRRCALHRKKL